MRRQNENEPKLLPVNRDVPLDPHWEEKFWDHKSKIANAKPKVSSWFRNDPVQQAKVEQTVRVKELSKKKEKQESTKEIVAKNKLQSERLKQISERVPKLDLGMIKRPDKAELQRREREQKLKIIKQNEMLADRLSRIKPVITTQKVAKSTTSTKTQTDGSERFRLLDLNSTSTTITTTMEMDTLDTSVAAASSNEWAETSAKDTEYSDKSDGYEDIISTNPSEDMFVIPPEDDDPDTPEIRAFVRFLNLNRNKPPKERVRRVDPDFGWSDYDDSSDSENDFFVMHAGKNIINKKYMSREDIICAKTNPDLEPGEDGYDSQAEVVFTESESEAESVHSDTEGDADNDNYEADDDEEENPCSV